MRHYPITEVQNERLEHLHKHGWTVEKDYLLNRTSPERLVEIAKFIVAKSINYSYNYIKLMSIQNDFNLSYLERILAKPYYDRLKIAASMLIAQMDVTLKDNEVNNIVEPVEKIIPERDTYCGGEIKGVNNDVSPDAGGC